MAHAVTARAVGPAEALSAAELQAWYRSYRRQQAALLASVLPSDAVRPLYRRARTRAREDQSDPLALLRGLCEELLPLPPYEVWLSDFVAHPDAHLRDLGAWAEAPPPEKPMTVALRRFHSAGVTWTALLRAYRDTSGWRGLIAFHDPEGQVFRTGRIFHESDPLELEGRFLSFDEPALDAFLRSALP